MPRCEICERDDFTVIATEIREGRGRISQCKSCGLIIQDARRTAKEIDRYYNEEYQTTNSLDSGKEQSPREHFDARLKTIQSIVGRLNKFLRPDMRVLEIGCGAGELLYSIRPYVGDVIGVELSKGFVDFMNKELSIEAYAEDVNNIDFRTKKFDLIISIATLDHLPDPLRTLEAIKRLLSGRGKVYIELPNLNEALNFYLPEQNRKAFNKFFWHKAHFFYFTPDTLSRIMEKAGFSCEISCRHEYTFRNYLNWYFRGSPEATFIDAATGVNLFSGDSEFERGINEIFYDAEDRFHKLMSRTFRGDTLCCLASLEKR